MKSHLIRLLAIGALLLAVSCEQNRETAHPAAPTAPDTEVAAAKGTCSDQETHEYLADLYDLSEWNTETISLTVTPEDGGTVFRPFGRWHKTAWFAIIVEPGDVDETVTLTMEIPYMENPDDPVPDVVFKFEPAGLVFNDPITVYFSYPPWAECLLPDGYLQLIYIDEVPGDPPHYSFGFGGASSLPGYTPPASKFAAPRIEIRDPIQPLEPDPPACYGSWTTYSQVCVGHQFEIPHFSRWKLKGGGDGMPPGWPWDDDDGVCENMIK